MILLFVFVSHFAGCGALVFQESEADQKLHVRQLESGDGCLGGWNAINPSFAALPGTNDFAVAMRGLCLRKEGHRVVWISSMVVGSIPATDIRAGSRHVVRWKSLTIAPDLRRIGGNTHECHIPGLDSAQGPEDPRFVKTWAGLYAVVTGYNVVESIDTDSPECGEVGMLLYAAKVENLSPPEFGPPVRLTFRGMGAVEKNWAMFTPQTVRGSDVFAVYSVFPHSIAQVNLHDGNVTFIAKSESIGLMQLARQLGVAPGEFHGGAGVAHSQNKNIDYFLSVLHTAVRRKDGSKEYWNYPYKFSQKSPYRILCIGKRLPLQLQRNPVYGEFVAFVTTVMMDDGDVFISYGSGDRSSRTFRMSHQAFDAKFFPTASDFQQEIDYAEGVDEDDITLLARPTRATMGLSDAQHMMNCSGDLVPSICRPHLEA